MLAGCVSDANNLREGRELKVKDNLHYKKDHVLKRKF